MVENLKLRNIIQCLHPVTHDTGSDIFTVVNIVIMVLWNMAQFSLIIMCRGICVTNIQVLDQMIGFIGTSVIISVNYNQYSAIADLHNLQFTVTHALGFSVFSSCVLVMELKESHCD
jgi:hypothetical protein